MRSKKKKPTTEASNTLETLTLGLRLEEVEVLKAAHPNSRLGILRSGVIANANNEVSTPPIQRDKYLTDSDKCPKYFPLSKGMLLGFGEDYNEHMDALGLAYALTGTQAYATELGRHLTAWSLYSPLSGVGELEGGEPSIYLRNFYCFFRGIEMAWEGLSSYHRGKVVVLAITILDTLNDWWAHTDWRRNNHAAATNQTGVYAALTLLRAAKEGLYSIPAAQVRLSYMLTNNPGLTVETMIGGGTPLVGLLGFRDQVRGGVNTDANRSEYGELSELALTLHDGSLDYYSKPQSTRMGYHGLLLHHTLTCWWAIERSSLNVGSQDQKAEQRYNIGKLLEFTRPYLQHGTYLPESEEQPPSADKDRKSREIIAMAEVLFPEKIWLSGLLDSEPPLSVGEAYYATSLLAQ